MAATAYILLQVEPAQTQAVVDRLRTIPGAFVRELLGPYDVIIELDADTTEDITGVLRSKIRPIPGISSTVTCMCL